MARQLHKDLRDAGLPFRLRSTERDLGIDLTAGRTRKVPVAKGRWLKASWRSKRLRTLAKRNARAGAYFRQARLRS